MFDAKAAPDSILVAPSSDTQIAVEPRTRRTKKSSVLVAKPRIRSTETRILLVSAKGVIVTDSPVMSPYVAKLVEVFNKVLVLCTFASARRLITSFVSTFHAAAVATSPAASR